MLVDSIRRVFSFLRRGANEHMTSKRLVMTLTYTKDEYSDIEQKLKILSGLI